jgi:hypothetical protein
MRLVKMRSKRQEPLSANYLIFERLGTGGDLRQCGEPARLPAHTKGQVRRRTEYTALVSPKVAIMRSAKIDPKQSAARITQVMDFKEQKSAVGNRAWLVKGRDL